MSRRSWLVAALVALLTVVVVALAKPPRPGPTTHGSSGSGLLSAYRYLDARGHSVRRWERPLAELPTADGTLVIAAPFALDFSREDARALRSWMGQGGTVLVAPSGGQPDPREQALLDSLGLFAVQRRTDPPLWWGDWKAWRSAQVQAWPGDPAAAGPLVGRVETHGVTMPAGAEVLYADPQGQAVAWSLAQRPGRLILLSNATPWGNALLAEGHNLAVLEELLTSGGPVWFDEVHHGHLDATATDLSDVVGPFELLLAHAALLYLLALFTLSRRYGPVLDRIRTRRGSLARDLLALATLHEKGAHHHQAGTLLLQLARDQARRRGTHPDLPEVFEGGSDQLLTLARQIGEHQHRGRL